MKDNTRNFLKTSLVLDHKIIRTDKEIIVF